MCCSVVRWQPLERHDAAVNVRCCVLWVVLQGFFPTFWAFGEHPPIVIARPPRPPFKPKVGSGLFVVACFGGVSPRHSPLTRYLECFCCKFHPCENWVVDGCSHVCPRVGSIECMCSNKLFLWLLSRRRVFQKRSVRPFSGGSAPVWFFPF